MKTNIFLTICCLLISIATLLASADPDPDKSCYYLDLNQTDTDQVISLPSFDVCLKYYDQHAQTSHLPVLFRNWKLDTLNFQLLTKEFGNNYYSFNLKTLGVSEEKEVYTLIYKNESGKNQAIKFRVTPKEKEEIILNIESTPISSNCGNVEGNLIEFKGMIQGGVPPYTVSWRVMEVESDAPLYQSRTDEVISKGYTPSIQVDISPAYKVMMEVTDACQGASHQILSVNCEDDFKNPNSIFIEPMKKIVTPQGVELSN